VAAEALNLPRPEKEDSTTSRYARRNGIVQLVASGIEDGVVAWYMGCSVRTVVRWGYRVMAGELLVDRERSGRPVVLNEQVASRVVSWYLQSKPLDTCGQWTLRWAACRLEQDTEVVGTKVSKSSIHRMVQSHRLKPHLQKYFLHITDPDFFPKMEHILDVYRRKLPYLFCFDECPGIQVLQRHVPRTRSAGKAVVLEESHYSRRGTVDVMAFLQVSNGNVIARTTSNHTAESFGAVFEEHVRAWPADEQLHYIMDNLSTHCNHQFCKLVARLSHTEYHEAPTVAQRREWLGREDKRIVIHFTPYHGSWLNMVEIWFSILRAKCLNHCPGTAQLLRDAVERFTVAEWNAYLAHEFEWKYTGEGLHEKVVVRFTGLLWNHHTELRLPFLTKHILLMLNMARDYGECVSTQAWENLALAIESRWDYFGELVNNETRPKVRSTAEETLNRLLAGMSNGPLSYQRKVA